MKHGKYLKEAALYRRWKGMRERCNNPRHKNYDRYGGRGIRVCPRWDDFANFLEDVRKLGPCPPGCSLDREDNDKDYGPENCRWATATRQCRNQCRTLRLTWRGETLSVPDWSDRLGIPVTCLRWRVKAGWSVERALTTPSGTPWKHTGGRSPTRMLTYHGETLSLPAWGRRLDLPVQTIRARLRYGWSAEKALSAPLRAYKGKR